MSPIETTTFEYKETGWIDQLVKVNDDTPTLMMKKFKLINICAIKKIHKYEKNIEWIKSEIIPYYRDRYVCYTLIENYNFNELMTLYLNCNGDVQIGAISVIAEKFAVELYCYILKKGQDMPKRKIKFIYELVVPDYLPFVLPRDVLSGYDFKQTYMDNIWVKICKKIETYLA